MSTFIVKTESLYVIKLVKTTLLTLYDPKKSVQNAVSRYFERETYLLLNISLERTCTTYYHLKNILCQVSYSRKPNCRYTKHLLDLYLRIHQKHGYRQKMTKVCLADLKEHYPIYTKDLKKTMFEDNTATANFMGCRGNPISCNT